MTKSLIWWRTSMRCPKMKQQRRMPKFQKSQRPPPLLLRLLLLPKLLLLQLRNNWQCYRNFWPFLNIRMNSEILICDKLQLVTNQDFRIHTNVQKWPKVAITLPIIPQLQQEQLRQQEEPQQQGRGSL